MNTAVIGAGFMARYHIEGFRRSGAQVVAIVDANAKAAARAAGEYGISQIFTDTAAMLAAVKPDAVAIIVPNKFHAPLTIQCLKAGAHVLCEKPPALNAHEVEQIIAAANKADRRLMFNFNNRARPEAKTLKQYIGDGTVGTINSVQAKWVRRTGIPGFGGWFTTKEMSGGGPLIDLLHMLDLGLYFMNFPEPTHVLAQTFNTFATDKAFKGPWGLPDKEGGTCDVETAVHGFVTFKTGQCLSLQISWAEMVEREEVSVTFQGTKAGGRMRRLYHIDGHDDHNAIDSCDLFVQEHGNTVNRAIKTPGCPDMGRSGSAENFIRSVRGEVEPLNTPDQALRLMKIVDALYASAQSGKPCTL
jgi:predicted dehydrogenase